MPPIRIDGDVALATDDLFAGVVTSCFSMRSLDRFTVDHPAEGLASRAARSRSTITASS
jgi:hypothetical protein